MSQHRGERVKPRYGRLTALGSSLAVTLIAVLGGTGVLPSAAGGDPDRPAANAAASIKPVAEPSTSTQPVYPWRKITIESG